MEGQSEWRIPRLARGAVLGVLAAVPALIALRGFTVDDALIPARYAAHLAHGLGYRFNARGPATDGVTPLGFAHLLAPFAGAGPLAALHAARILGAAGWLAAAALLGARIEAIGSASLRYTALLLILLSAPLGAWAVAGLETGLVISLATLAAALPLGAAGCIGAGAAAGLVAELRPEMLPWALVIAFGRASLVTTARARVAIATLSVLPWCAAVALRLAFFGRPAPLAVLAKPSDLAHGLIYVVPNLAFTGAPLAAMGIGVWRHVSRWPRTLAVAALVHLGVVALVGGDWMPLARLVTPILPSLVLVVAHQLATPAPRAFALARLAFAGAAEILLFALRGPAASRVLADRLALIEWAKAPLAGAERVATIDVGWVGAVSDTDIFDLAGATDLAIAALPGGHTSKNVSAAMLMGRNPDRLVFELEPYARRTRGWFGVEAHPRPSAPFLARAVEQRLANDPLIRGAYDEMSRSPDDLAVQYIVLSRTPRQPRMP
jgi:hypothetical protein